MYYGIFKLPCEQLDRKKKKKKKKPDRLAPILPQRKIVYMYRNFDSKKVVLFIIYINIQ